MVNVTIYSIHGSYGLWFDQLDSVLVPSAHLHFLCVDLSQLILAPGQIVVFTVCRIYRIWRHGRFSKLDEIGNYINYIPNHLRCLSRRFEQPTDRSTSVVKAFCLRVCSPSLPDHLNKLPALISSLRANKAWCRVCSAHEPSHPDLALLQVAIRFQAPIPKHLNLGKDRTDAFSRSPVPPYW